MPYYDHICQACNQEFEEFYSITKDPPTICSLCGVEGQVKRLISDAVHGSVKLEGQDLKKHIVSEREKLKKEISNNENTRANIVGEKKYQEQVVASEKLKERYKNI